MILNLPPPPHFAVGGGPFLDGYVLVMISAALATGPGAETDADRIGLLGAGTLAGLFVAIAAWLSPIQSRTAQMFLIDTAIGGYRYTMFVSSCRTVG